MVNTTENAFDMSAYQTEVEAELGYDNEQVDLSGYEDDEEAEFKWN